MNQRLLVCEKNKCTGCMACVAVCPKNAITIEDTLSAYNAAIAENLCVNCKLCEKVCQNHHRVAKYEPLKWYEGWATETDVRARASSGGIATAIAKGFLRNGGYVCSCVFDKGKFSFQLTNQEENLWRSSGSKYVKSDPRFVYHLIREKLVNQQRVLFIGLPCQVAGVKRFVSDALQKHLYTVDLVCHGTPSPKLLEIFMRQYHRSLQETSKIQFRIKEKMQLLVDDIGIVKKGVSDCYTISFLNGINYTENCYACQYADSKRISDLTLGDSWGTDRINEHQKGISLILCQTVKGKELLDFSNVVLFSANQETAISNNQQLEHPSRCPEKREWFFRRINEGCKYNHLVWRLYFKQCFKQFVKKWLLRLRIVS